MRMSSGLEFDEVYTPFGDTAAMLCESGDFAAYAAAKPLAAAPGSRWSYSSGTANIISRIVRQAAETETPNSYHFLRRELFDAIGMTSAVMEADPSGTFVGSSYTFATPRDWARFGLLFLQDGVWNGKRILPEGWVTYTTTPAAKAPKGEYGAMFWLNAGATSDPPTGAGLRFPRMRIQPKASRSSRSSSSRRANWCWCDSGRPPRPRPGTPRRSSPTCWPRCLPNRVLRNCA